jgi:hypothetical protein
MPRILLFLLAAAVLAAGLAGVYRGAEPPRTPEAALEADAGNPYRWCEMGEALAREGKADRAGQCMRRAAELGREVPPVLMRVAVHWMAEGEEREALPLMSRVLGQTEAYDGVVFSYYRRLEYDVDRVLESGLPASERAWHAYLRDLHRWARPEDAARAWAKLRERGWTTEELAGEHATYLVREERYRDAVSAWADQLGDRRGPWPERNRVFNGDFSRQPSPMALDWQVRPVEGAAVERAREGPKESWALKVDFNGRSNVVFRHVWQTVYLPPGDYAWQAWLRTQGVTTEQGVYLALSGPGIDSRSRKLNGTRDWTRVTGRFLVSGAAWRPVRVELRRDESLKIDNKAWGTAWLGEIVVVESPGIVHNVSLTGN